jgi:hypothetical protein
MTPQQPHQTNNMRQWLSQAGPTLVLKLILLFIGVVIIATLFSAVLLGENLYFWPSLTLEQPVSADEETELLTQPGFVELVIDDLNLGIVQQFNPPQSLEIAGFQLPVSNRYLTDSNLWLPGDENSNQLGWLENSIINYVFRLPANRGYQDIVSEASVNQETVTLLTADGKQYVFQLNPADAPAIPNQPISQAGPAITFIWLDSDDNYHAVSGKYQPLAVPLSQVDYRPQTHGVDFAMSGLGDLSVRLDIVELHPNGLQLETRGVITNRGPDPQIISAQEIELESNGLVSQIIAAEPPLPWQIPANNSQMIFSLILQKPPGDFSYFTIGKQRYQINLVE